MSELGLWDSFYMIVGSAAGALVGLQFVVLTLIAERPSAQSADAGAAFATPTVVHFSVVLFLSALIRAPWRSITWISALWGVAAVAGIAYALVVARRMRTQTAYKPAFEDWLFHAVLPLATYLILGVSALMADAHTRDALFGVGATMLLLLFLGIHNAWDTVSYHLLVYSQKAKSNER
jgi:hypothetical protein